MPKTKRTKSKRTAKLAIAREEDGAHIMSLLDFGESCLRQYRHRGLPCTRRQGRFWYNPGEVVAWLREHPQLNRGVGRPETPRSKAWKAANLRKENAQADLAEIRLRQLHDKLVWRKDVEAAYAEVCRKVRAALEPFAKDMGRQIEGMTDVEQIERVMEDRIIAILTKLAEPTDDTAAAGKRV